MPAGITDGFVPTADSTSPSGITWQAQSGGSPAAEDVTVDSTTLVGTGTDAQAVFEELDDAIADHLADTVDAHDATAISFAPAGTIAATTVQAAIEEVASEAGGGTGVDWEDVGTTGGSFGPNVVQVVTATSSLTEANGAMALLRGGSTPFEFVALIYDATYGKWVSAPVPLIMQGNTFNDTGTGYTSQTTQNSLMIGNILGYRALYDAGARLQFRLKGLLANSGANNTFAQLQGAEFSDGDSAATAVFTACEIVHSGVTANFKVSAWTEPAGWSPADSHMRVVVQTKVAAGTGSYFQLFAEYRWTAAA